MLHKVLVGLKQVPSSRREPACRSGSVVEPSLSVLDAMADDRLLATRQHTLDDAMLQRRRSRVGGSLSALAFVVASCLAVLLAGLHVLGDVVVFGLGFGVVDHESVGVDDVESDVLFAWVYAEGVLSERGVVSLLGELDGEGLVTYGYCLSLAEEPACPGGTVHGLQRGTVCVEDIDDRWLVLVGSHARVPPFGVRLSSCFVPFCGVYQSFRC